MNEAGKTPQGMTDPTKGRSLIDFAIIVTKWRRFILTNILCVTGAAVVISLLMPNWYESTASVLPSKRKGSLFGEIAGFSTAIKDISKTLGKLGGGSDEAFNYLAILKSRSSFERVINQFNLREVYEIKKDAPIENVINELSGNVKFAIQEEGNVTVAVLDRDPRRAAEMANFFIAMLNEISVELSTREARNNREFIGQRFEQVKHDLAAAEDTLKVFQKKYGVYALPEQTKAAITAAAQLKTEIVAKEIELGIAERTVGAESPDLQTLRLQLSELNKKFEEMKNGSVSPRDVKQLTLFVPFRDLPDVGTEYIRLFRDFEIQNKMLEFFVPYYEQAKIEEQKNVPVVLVLDRAVPAEKKSRPMRSLIVLSAAVLSLLLSLSVVLMIEAHRRLKDDPERYRRIEEGIISPLDRSMRAILRRK